MPAGALDRICIKINKKINVLHECLKYQFKPCKITECKFQFHKKRVISANVVKAKIAVFQPENISISCFSEVAHKCVVST